MTVGSAIVDPRLSSNGSLPSRGSAPATVVSACPFTVDMVVVVKFGVVFVMDDETEKSSMVGPGGRTE